MTRRFRGRRLLGLITGHICVPSICKLCLPLCTPRLPLCRAVATGDVPSAMRLAVRNFDEDHTMWNYCVAWAFHAIDLARGISDRQPGSLFADADDQHAPDEDYLSSLLSPADAHLADASADADDADDAD